MHNIRELFAPKDAFLYTDNVYCKNCNVQGNTTQEMHCTFIYKYQNRNLSVLWVKDWGTQTGMIVIQWLVSGGWQFSSIVPTFLSFSCLGWSFCITYYVARSNYVAKIQVQDQCQIILRPLYNFPLNIKIFSTYKMFRFVVPVYCLMFILSIKLVWTLHHKPDQT